MLKFPAQAPKNKDLSYANSCITEYIGCHIFNSVGINAQETLLGTYEKNGVKKIVVACKDFTSPGIVLQDFASLKNTVVFTVITVPLQTAGSLVLAAVIAELFHNKFGNFVKSSLFVPVIASAILVGTLWFTLLSPRGVVNSIIHAFGLPSVNWLGGKLTSMLSVCIVSVWKNVGYFLVIYFAGIMDIPRSLYEAAEVDGANAFQRFFKITLPGLSSVTFLVVTLGTIWSFQVFDLVYTMTGGGPGTSTVTLVLTTYNAAFKEYNMGYASAVAMLMFVFVLAVSGLQKLLLKGGED